MFDITTLAAWGEFIGGIAVVVSLIYLAGQVRQNSKLVRASTTAATNQTQAAQNALVAYSYGRLVPARQVRGLGGLPGLSAVPRDAEPLARQACAGSVPGSISGSRRSSRRVSASAIIAMMMRNADT